MNGILLTVAVLVGAAGMIFFAVVLRPALRLRGTNLEIRKTLAWIAGNLRKMPPFSERERRGIGELFIYVPHPHLNWSLNPGYRNSKGEYDHTIEGFRKTSPADSVRAEADAGSPAIVCVGGSTTYCTELQSFRESWPFVLNQLFGDSARVFNFGVGGWTTLQSIIRLLAWFPVIKPSLVIFYQGKNDLTPLNNGQIAEECVAPDYQNLMLPFAAGLATPLPARALRLPLLEWRELQRLRSLEGLQSVYYNSDENLPGEEGLKRLDEKLLDIIAFRHRAVFSLCRDSACRVLYMPEIVRGGSYLTPLTRIYDRTISIAKDFENVTFFDMRENFPLEDEFFNPGDKMHFNPVGCQKFAEIVHEQSRKLLFT